MDDTTTFFLAFAAVFGGIALLLLHFERRAQALEHRLATLEAATIQRAGPTAGAPTTKPKPGPADERRKA
jgi:hypothetical protein